MQTVADVQKQQTWESHLILQCIFLWQHLIYFILKCMQHDFLNVFKTALILDLA